jgi:hypothetical protein
VRIFLYEHLTSGCWPAVGDGQAALMAEGRAMRDAVLADFSLLADVQSRILSGEGENPWGQFKRLAAESDWTLLIAPETGGRAAAALQSGGKSGRATAFAWEPVRGRGGQQAGDGGTARPVRCARAARLLAAQ